MLAPVIHPPRVSHRALRARKLLRYLTADDEPVAFDPDGKRAVIANTCAALKRCTSRVADDKNGSARSFARANASIGILEDQTMCGIDRKKAGTSQKRIGLRLAAFYVLRSNDDRRDGNASRLHAPYGKLARSGGNDRPFVGAGQVDLALATRPTIQRRSCLMPLERC